MPADVSDDSTTPGDVIRPLASTVLSYVRTTGSSDSRALLYNVLHSQKGITVGMLSVAYLEILEDYLNQSIVP